MSKAKTTLVECWKGGADMTNIEINGVEHVPLSSLDFDGSHEQLKERLTRAKETLETKQNERKAVENERALTSHINKHFLRELKDVDSFIELCKAKKLTADDDDKILKLYKSLPKSAKKNALERFLKK